MYKNKDFLIYIYTGDYSLIYCAIVATVISGRRHRNGWRSRSTGTATNKQKGPNNDFGLQSSHSLYDRLLLHRFPSTQLLVQYRMHPHICGLVNERIYINRLVNEESTQNLARDDDWAEFLKSWVPVSRSSYPIHRACYSSTIPMG